MAADRSALIGRERTPEHVPRPASLRRLRRRGRAVLQITINYCIDLLAVNCAARLVGVFSRRAKSPGLGERGCLYTVRQKKGTSFARLYFATKCDGKKTE